MSTPLRPIAAGLMLTCWAAPFTRAQPLVETAKFVPADGVTDDIFGWSTAVDDGLAAIGAPYSASYFGKVYTYQKIGGTYQPLQTLDDGIGVFGWALAMQDGWLVVGAPWDSGTNGRVYVYRFDGTGWVLDQVLADASSVGFGWSVAIHDGVIAVGAPETRSYKGEVTVFRYDGDDWVEEISILGVKSGISSGTSVALDDGELFVGAPYHYKGTVKVYRFAPAIKGAIAGVPVQWRKVQTLRPGGQTGQLYGNKLTVENGVLAVSAQNFDNGGPLQSTGRAFVYHREGIRYRQRQTLEPPQPILGSFFSYDLHLCDGTLAVVELRYGSTAKVLTYEFKGAAWVLSQTLIPADLVAGNGIYSVTHDGTDLLMGSPLDDDANPDTGAAYLFQR